MQPLALLVSHHERVTVRVDDVFIKINAEAWRTEREAGAIRHADVPTPTILWERPHVLALAEVQGAPLGTLGEPSTAGPRAWRAAGRLARQIHGHAAPAWPGWTLDDYVEHIDRDCAWLVREGVVPAPVVASARQRADAALRPFVPVFIHADYQPAHVFVAGDDVTGVIDWEDAGIGDAHLDIAVLTVGHEEHLPDAVAGYGAPLDFDVIRGWWAYRRIRSVRWMIEHGYDPTGDIATLERVTET